MSFCKVANEHNVDTCDSHGAMSLWQLRHQRKVPDLDYINKSMQYYAAMFPEVRFVACSDDRRFLLNKLVPNASFPIYTTGECRLA